MTGAELLLGGLVALALITVMVKGSARRRRAAAAAAVAEVGTSPVSLLGRVLVTAGVIVGVQWVVITYAAGGMVLLLVVLGLPALLAAYALTRALTVTEIRPTRAGGRR